MREAFEKNDCGRAGQLIGYLYGEAAAAERADFERHLRDCAACREEVAAFTRVRGSVAEFRSELLRAAPPVSLAAFAADADAQPTAAQPTTAPRAGADNAAHASPLGAAGAREPLADFASPVAPPAGFASPVAGPRPSAGAAWAALREFFRLSPAWLRASTAAAALALCALALLAVANAEISFGDERYALRTGVRPAAAAPNAPAPAQPEELTALQTRLKNLAAERDAAVSELEATREELDDSRAANLVAAEFEAEPVAPRDSAATRDQPRTRRAPSAAKSESPSRGPRRRSEDEDLPRLLDLLGGAN